MHPASGLALVKTRIAAACQRSGRSADSVVLVAVSKLQPVESILDAYQAGQRDFGENYPQELRDKAAELAKLEGLRWHAIGPLQTNKAKYVAKVAHAFHALDRLELGQELAQRREGAPLRCLLQVNVSAETSKHGVAPSGVPALVESLRALSGLEVTGLMTLPPPAAEPEEVRPYFRQLAGLARSLGLPELSMGTTGDFEVAIEEGATLVRVGTAIFGERPA